MKKCNKCLKEYPLDGFNKFKRSKDGYMSYCKVCHHVQVKANRGKYKEYDKEYAKTQWPKNKDRIREEYREYFKIYKRERRKDPIFRLKENMRNYFYQSFIKNRNAKRDSILSYIGCSFDDLKIYLENSFDKNMSWENYGSYWEIDHKDPIFNFSTSEEDLHKCWNYRNLQPLTISENRIKHNKIQTK